MIRAGVYSEFVRKFQLWKEDKGLSSEQIAEIAEISLEEVGFMLSGRLPFSLSFLSKLSAYYPDLKFLHADSTIIKRKSVVNEVTNRFWDKLKPALAKPEEVNKVVIFYKNGTYMEF